MNSPTILRISPRSNCLSAWQLAQLACGDAQADRATRAHLTRCARCAALLRQQKDEVAQAAAESMPASLLEGRQEPRPRSRAGAAPWLWARRGAAALALTAACALATLQLGPGAARLQADGIKGDVSLLATVMRDAQFVAEDAPVEQMPALQAQDRVRLRLVGAATGAAVVLQVQNDGRWETLFEGPLPADHWLPMGLRMDGKPTSVRLQVCDPALPCTDKTFTF